MRTCVVDPSYQQSYAIRPLPVVLSVGLSTVTYLIDNAFHRHGAPVCHFRGEALLFHEVGENAGVRRKPGNSDTHVRVDRDDLLLVRGEFFGITLQCFDFAPSAPGSGMWTS
jgi:hypothetical protein